MTSAETTAQANLGLLYANGYGVGTNFANEMVPPSPEARWVLVSAPPIRISSGSLASASTIDMKQIAIRKTSNNSHPA